LVVGCGDDTGDPSTAATAPSPELARCVQEATYPQDLAKCGKDPDFASLSEHLLAKARKLQTGLEMTRACERSTGAHDPGKQVIDVIQPMVDCLRAKDAPLEAVEVFLPTV